MITEKDRNHFRGIFPSEFARVIAMRLISAGKIPKRAKKYTPKIVKLVFDSRQEDLNVELELFRYSNEIEKEKQELEELRGKKYNGDEVKEGKSEKVKDHDGQ